MEEEKGGLPTPKDYIDAENERRARGESLSFSEYMAKLHGDTLAEWLEDAPLVQCTPEEQWNAYKEHFSLSDLRALRNRAEEQISRLEEHIEMWSQRRKAAAEGVTVFAELEERDRTTLSRYTSVCATLDSLIDYALAYMEPPPEYSDLSEDVKKTVSNRQNESTPGRSLVIDDPGAFPKVILKALLEWTDNKENKGKPFRSQKHDDTLCGYIKKRVTQHVKQQDGYEPEIPIDTIKSRLRSLMEDGLGVDLPSHTNVRSYFEKREEIKDAMKEQEIEVR